MDTQLFLKINGFAKSTTFAHGFFHYYAIFIGLSLLAVAIAATIVRAVLAGRGIDTDRQIAAALIAGLAAAVAFVINQPISHAINRTRPFAVLRGVEVLIPRAHDGGMPSDHATVAGAIIVGLWLSHDRATAIFATVVGVLLAFARVYVGVHYPTDVLAGLGLGAVTVLIGYAALAPSLAHLVGLARKSPAARRPGKLEVPVVPIRKDTTRIDQQRLATTGSVRILSDHPLTPQRHQHGSDGAPVSDVTSS